ncbi:sigma-70 family RNA polymerase sigma factor [Citricoccus sp.]|uniref:RNA polymerase sigma factor n=1 Tax=Citricoccus sp. TaxID=1978372 RepID=UPI0028BD9EC9|nr:sigma-70 family RNA polymerase sigma factor [Citricoccus sp.]
MTEPFEQAVQRHGATVLRVCRAVLGPGPDADDAWQETFLTALRQWPDLAPGMNLEAWLVRVAGRKAIDVLRARSRGAVPMETLPERPAPDGVPGNGADGLWSVVASLPERQRLAVAYHYLGGLPHAETAALIGGSVEAVRRASSDGIRALRGILGADEGTPDHTASVLTAEPRGPRGPRR